jgi:hypothetical protein
VREDQVALPDGNTTIYGVVECAGCVGVLPFLDAETVVLVGQYRYVFGSFYWEMPTGAMTPARARRPRFSASSRKKRATRPSGS